MAFVEAIDYLSASLFSGLRHRARCASRNRDSYRPSKFFQPRRFVEIIMNLPLRRFIAANLLFLISASLVTTCSAWFFLPGISPTDYAPGMPLLVLANKLTSDRSRIPHDYMSMPFCKPSQRSEGSSTSVQTVHTSFAQLLQGERARLTAYNITMLGDRKCELACISQFAAQDVELLSRRIQRAYRVRLSLDDMPVVVRSEKSAFKLGYPLGKLTAPDESGAAKITVFNHLDFTVRYHAPDGLIPVLNSSVVESRFRVVGFEVEPSSHMGISCESNTALEVPLKNPTSMDIPFTYSVTFVHSDVNWMTRFDTLIRVSPGRQKIQWFAIVNSLMFALFLSATLAAVLLRTLRRDCARYGISAEALGGDFDDDFESDSGWRILRGDVFRAPDRAGLLCVLCGSGTQLALVAFVTLGFALFGVLSPRRRGSLLTGLLTAWVLSAGVAGYVAARLHKAMGGTRWRRVTIGVAFMLPSVAFSIFTFLNLVMWGAGSIGAAPILAMVLLLFLWFGVSVPLAFAGTYFGYRHKAYNFAVRTNQIPRPIPTQPWYLKAPSVYALCGLVPFGVVCIELRLILNSIWQNEFYHMFAFLFSVFVLLAITCAEVSVVLVFLKLSNSDYMWWWDSWLACASSGVYVFLYSLYYLGTHAVGGGAGSLPAQFLFVSYSLLGSLMFSLLTGSIGFLSSLAFTRRIYSASVYD